MINCVLAKPFLSPLELHCVTFVCADASEEECKGLTRLALPVLRNFLASRLSLSREGKGRILLPPEARGPAFVRERPAWGPYGFTPG